MSDKQIIIDGVDVSKEFIRRTPMFGVHKQILQKISEVISE